MSNAEAPIHIDEIARLEFELDNRASQLAAKYNELAAPVRARNEDRWELFAVKCRKPVIGKFFQRMHVQPENLELEPSFDEIPNFRSEAVAIEAGARELERLKVDKMDQYGDEIISFGLVGPYTATRKECYELGETPDLPKKYDMFSASGSDKFKKGAYVMDFQTKQVIPVTECKFILTEPGKGTIYSRSRPDMPFGSTLSDFF